MPNLDSPSTILRYDSSNMMGLIASLPRQCRQAKKIGSSFKLPDSYKAHYDNIVCTGLGGSAIGADIARSYLSDTVKVPIYVNRFYRLPGFVGHKTLVIASSYSGDTEETLSAYKDARKKRSKIIAVTSGGALRKMASRDGCPALIIPGGLPPRAAFGYSSVSILSVLAKAGIIADQSKNLDEAISVMDRLRDGSIGPNVPKIRNAAKSLACKLYGKYPVIYASQDRFDAVATRWRGQFAENAKTLGSTHFFPEMNHNEIVGWDFPARILKNFAVVVLRDIGDHPRVSKRIDITEEVIDGRCSSVTQVSSSGVGLLARIFSLVYMGDFTSLYLAMLNRTDPTPVERIKYLKERLGSVPERKTPARSGRKGAA